LKDNYNMDDFIRHKKRHVGSIDGVMQADTFERQGGKAPVIAEDNLRIGQLDNFRNIEGFSPNAQAPISRPGAEKPAELGYNSVSSANHIDEPIYKTSKQQRNFNPFRRKQKPLKVKTKRSKLKLGLKLTGALATLVILVGGGLVVKTYFKTRSIFTGNSTGAVALNKVVDPTLLKGEGDGRVNILLLGKGGPGHDGPDLTDTILVASVDPVAKDVALLSIPRDLWVRNPSGGQSKINAVYPNAKYSVLDGYTVKKQTDAVRQQAEAAGIKAIEDTVTASIGIPIHYYSMVDFTAFKQAIDAVSGVDINVTTQLYDPNVAWENKNNPLIAAVGQQHFDGARALLYARSREGSLRGDFDRTERQRELLAALKTKVLTLGTFANPLKLNQLINAFGDHVSTDFSLNEMLRVYDTVKGVDTAQIKSIGLADPPNNFVTTGTINGLSVVIPRAGISDFADIKSYVRNTLRDPFLKSENANVIVLNGTETPGLATLKSTELKSFGYNVTLIADAPTKTYTATTLIDLTKGVKKYTKNYLEKRLGVKAVTALPDATIIPGAAEFVIILGSNDAAAGN
jgi:polyisoprenyl-teichoic acid--peptidoglycan teichoic acid transferase